MRCWKLPEHDRNKGETDSQRRYSVMTARFCSPEVKAGSLVTISMNRKLKKSRHKAFQGWYSISQYDERTSWNRVSPDAATNKRRQITVEIERLAGMYDMDNIKTDEFTFKDSTILWQPPELLIMTKFIFVLETSETTRHAKTLNTNIGRLQSKTAMSGPTLEERPSSRFLGRLVRKDYNAPGNPLQPALQTLKCTL